jgi:hypothetical protein
LLLHLPMMREVFPGQMANRALSAPAGLPQYERWHTQLRKLLIASVLLVTSLAAAVADQEVTVDSVRRGERLLVPVRGVFEGLGATVEWLPDTHAVQVTGKGSAILLTVNQSEATVGGEVVAMDAPAINWNERVLVPLRFVAERLGSHVDYEGDRVVVTGAGHESLVVHIQPQVVAPPAPRVGVGGGCSSCGR